MDVQDLERRLDAVTHASQLKPIVGALIRAVGELHTRAGGDTSQAGAAVAGEQPQTGPSTPSPSSGVEGDPPTPAKAAKKAVSGARRGGS